MSARAAGLRVMLTAAAAGIGRAAAIRLADEGAAVLASDIDADGLARLPAGIEARRIDARDAGALAAAAADWRPDALVAAAGWVPSGTVLETGEDDFDRAFELNVKATYRALRAVLPGMIQRGRGSIVTIASVVSSITGAPNRAVYGATKGAVIGLTKQIARDHVGQGIRANAVCPGTVDTPSLQARLRATGDYDAALRAFLARQPMGRFASAEEVAQLILYLVSDESAFVTGQAYVIDGGWTG